MKEDMKLLKLSASWCSPCKQLSKTLDSMDIRIPVEEIDIDAQRNIAQIYNVRSVPTLILVEDGYEVRRHLGNASTEMIKEFLGEYA